MLLLVGLVLLALGLVSGASLVFAAFGVGAVQAGYVLWGTFPVLCVVGYLMVAGHAQGPLLRNLSLAASGLLLLLALASVCGIVLGAAGIVPAPGNVTPLWYVLVVGLFLGGLCAAAFSRATPASPA
jgi:hypothetical protein